MYIFKDTVDFLTQTKEKLLAQGEQSLNSKGACLYRSPSGKGCAIGIHLEDECYDERMEDMAISRILGSGNDLRGSRFDKECGAVKGNLKKKFKRVDKDALNEAQYIHDDFPNASSWERRFDVLIKRYS